MSGLSTAWPCKNPTCFGLGVLKTICPTPTLPGAPAQCPQKQNPLALQNAGMKKAAKQTAFSNLNTVFLRPLSRPDFAEETFDLFAQGLGVAGKVNGHFQNFLRSIAGI